jgi:hypothetical protein
MSCEIFGRSNTQAPQFVRDYLDDSKDLLVRVCSGGANNRHYLGASNLIRDGNICRYSEYGLNLLSTSPPRLERKTTTPPQTYMSVSESSTCPPPEAIRYTATNDVPQDIFERLMHVWRDAISSPASFDMALPKISNLAVSHQLRDAILQGKGNRLTVLSVDVGRDLGLWKSYNLEVVMDPYHFDQIYDVAVSSWFGRIYGISNVGKDDD